MPTWQWSYPYDSADTATVHFGASPADALCHWRTPLIDAPQVRQIYVRTLDGGVRCYESGGHGRVIELTFDGLPEGSAASATALWGYRGLKEFLTTHTGFGLRTFGLFDHEGLEELEVRYFGGVESFRRHTGGVYSGAIRLAEETQ